MTKTYRERLRQAFRITDKGVLVTLYFGNLSDGVTRTLTDAFRSHTKGFVGHHLGLNNKGILRLHCCTRYFLKDLFCTVETPFHKKH